jgi:hypothetical protein
MNLLSLKTGVVVPTVNNRKKTIFFVGFLRATEEKSRIRIRNPVVRVSGSGSGPGPAAKRYGSGTLERIIDYVVFFT